MLRSLRGKLLVEPLVRKISFAPMGKSYFTYDASKFAKQFNPLNKMQFPTIYPPKYFSTKNIKDKISEKYGDPTIDETFKMLFAKDENKDILISLLNSLLDFKGEKEIVDVEINPTELEVMRVSEKKGKSNIDAAVDVLCTNKGKQKIAIEIQGQKTSYLLSREQSYMAKLISAQVKEGEGKLYDKALLDTYIIVISKESVFIGNTALKDKKMFEIDVKPIVVQSLFRIFLRKVPRKLALPSVSLYLSYVRSFSIASYIFPTIQMIVQRPIS